MKLPRHSRDNSQKDRTPVVQPAAGSGSGQHAGTQDVQGLMRRAAQAVPLFTRWPAAHLDRLLGAAQLRSYAPGETMATGYRQLREVVVVVSGCVELSNVSPQGKRHVMPLFGAGQVIGLLRMLDQPVSAADWRALESTQLIHIPCAPLKDLLDELPMLWRDVAMFALQRHRASARARHHLAVSDPVRRLSSTLLELVARHGSRDNGRAVQLKVVQSELAGMVGISRQTVRKVLDELEGRRVLSTGYRRIQVLDPENLRRMAQ